tara:strand:- start:1340 stop:2401 length:1062 start_codon:yes stop_codon:yes gene_type:complete
MPAYLTNGVGPRQELGLAIVEGEGSMKGLIGDKLLGPLGISYRNAHLVKATLAGSLGLRHIAHDKYVRAMGTKFHRLTATFGEATLTVTPRGVEISVPRELMADYNKNFDVLGFFAGRFGSELGPITKEYLIASATVGSGSTYIAGSATNSTVAYTAALLSTNSFIADVIASVRRVKANGEVPDTVVMSGPVAERIRQAATVQAYAAGTLKAGQEATWTMIGSALKEFGIEQVLIGDTYYNNAADGDTPSLSQVWGNTYILVCRAGRTQASTAEGVLTPSLSGIGANVFWEGFDSQGTPSLDKEALDFQGAGGFFVEVYPSKETKSEIIRIEMSHKPTITNTRAGDLIATQYS